MNVPGWLIALFALPLFGDALDRFQVWVRRYRGQIEEGDEYPPFSFLLWVRVVHRNPDYDHDLWVVKLPIYDWRQIDFRRYGWAQLAYMRRCPFAKREISDGHGWRACHIVSQVADASYP